MKTPISELDRISTSAILDSYLREDKSHSRNAFFLSADCKSDSDLHAVLSEMMGEDFRSEKYEQWYLNSDSSQTVMFVGDPRRHNTEEPMFPLGRHRYLSSSVRG